MWINIFVLVLVFVLGVFVFVVLVEGSQEDWMEIFCQFEFFGDVLMCIEVDYVFDIEQVVLIEVVIEGMLDLLDLYFSYYNFESYQDFQVIICGEYGGLGMEVVSCDDYIIVVFLISDILAECVGLWINDCIIVVDGEDICGVLVIDVVELMCGVVGDLVIIMIFCGDDVLFDVIFVCDIILLCMVVFCIEEGLFYLCIFGFNECMIEMLLE